VERQLGLTRQCLEVCLRFRNPAGIVTKNALVLRDIDVLREMASRTLVQVMVSITSLKPELLRLMEPRASSAARRLDAIEDLARAGVPVGVNVAPIVPGLTDEELPSILKASVERGATSAGYILVRLPGAVQPIFLDWLHRHFPDREQKILNRLRDTRDGRLTDSRFGSRIFGQGEIARTIQSLFDLHVSRFHLESRWCGVTSDSFRPPSDAQGDLFEG
jgi:DNA repair photolyase